MLQHIDWARTGQLATIVGALVLGVAMVFFSALDDLRSPEAEPPAASIRS